MFTRPALVVAAASLGVFSLAVTLGPAPSAHAASGTTVVYAGNGAQDFRVPDFVRSIEIVASGGAGEDGVSGNGGTNPGGDGGPAGVVDIVVPVVPGDVLHLAAGGSGAHSEWGVPGFEGGLGGAGDSPGGERGGHGGSASTVSLNGTLIVVAAGGGGGGGGGISPLGADGGAGGGGRGTQGTRGDGNGNGPGGAGLVTGTGMGRAGNGGVAALGTVAGGGGGGGGGWLPSISGGGGNGGAAGTWGGGGGGGGGGGNSWSQYPGATVQEASSRLEGSIRLNWSPRPTVKLTASANPVEQGSPLTFRIDVGAAVAGAPIANGTVSLTTFDISTSAVTTIGTGKLVNGTVTIPVTMKLPLGQNFFGATYSGDGYYEQAASGYYNEVVGPVAVHGLVLSASYAAFFPQPVNAVVSRTVTLTNTGNVSTGQLAFASDGPQFSVQAAGCSSGPLAPGASCDFQIQFSSPVEWLGTAHITVTDQAAGGASASLLGSGIVIAPSVTASTTTLDFGSTPLGTPVDRTFTLTNPQNLPWQLETAGLPVGPFTTVGHTCTHPLAINESCAFTIRFTPSAAGTAKATLLIVDNSGGSHTTITMSGTGVAPTPPPTPAPKPVATSITPTHGSRRGGTTVTINGQNLAGVTAVLFGSSPARSFTCSSPTRCSAVSPAGPARSTVDVRLAGPGGTSAVTNKDRFTYDH